MPPILAVLRIVVVAFALLCAIPTTDATKYAITKKYSGPNFFEDFDFVISDPSAGYVQYQTQEAAIANGYIHASDAGIYLGVDHHTTIAPRRSVRIESKDVYTHGLFIGDFNHMPSDICGVWPAFWMYGVGVEWPTYGEIDIIEGVNLQKTNHMTGHTTAGCSVSAALSAAKLEDHNCNANDGYTGCSFVAPSESSYGSGFNKVGGGVYAMQWTSTCIKIWHWTRKNIPLNIKQDRPDPAQWGPPVVNFWGGNQCNIDEHFRQMKLVLNIDFCGAWADGLWASSGCTSRAPTCEAHVQNNPAAFTNAYWHVNYIKAFHALSPVDEENIVISNATWGTAAAQISNIPLPDTAMGNPVPPIYASGSSSAISVSPTLFSSTSTLIASSTTPVPRLRTTTLRN